MTDQSSPDDRRAARLARLAPSGSPPPTIDASERLHLLDQPRTADDPAPLSSRMAPAPAPDELDRALARRRSYLLPAVVVFVLYWAFYFPGLIANLLFLREAFDTARVAGRTPSGTWVLASLLAIGLIPLLALASCMGVGGALLL